MKTLYNNYMPTDIDRKLRVFLSYAKEDFELVQELYNRLKSEEWIDPWLDKSALLPGEHWRAAIKREIDKADAVIIFLSDNSINKEGFVHYEMNYAFERSLHKPPGAIYRIPIRLDDCDVPEDLYELDDRQWVDYFGGIKDDTYKKLLMALKQRLVQKEKFEARERARIEVLIKKQAEELAHKEAEELRRRLAEMRGKENAAIQFEMIGDLSNALNLYYEIRSIDRTYTTIESKIDELERKVGERKKNEEIKAKESKAIQLELLGDLANTVKLYYEIRNIDLTYPYVDAKIGELEQAIRLKDEKSRKEAEELARKQAEEKVRKEKEERLFREADAKKRAELRALIFSKLLKRIPYLAILGLFIGCSFLGVFRGSIARLFPAKTQIIVTTVGPLYLPTLIESPIQISTPTPKNTITPTIPSSTITPTETATLRPIATLTSIATLLGVVTGDRVNVRSGPGLVYPGIVKYDKGAELTILGQNQDGTWLVVSLPDGAKGWISSTL